MKHLSLFVWLLVGISILPACKRANQLEQEAMRQDSINAALQDSINTANAEKDSLMQLMGDIADGMQQIKELQDIVSVNNLNGETPDRKKQLRDDIVLIQQSINKHKQRLAELERRLKQSTNYNATMQKSIDNMKTQLEEQQKTINNLTEQLAAAHIQIKNLNQSVDSLSTVNKNVTREKEAAEQVAASEKMVDNTLATEGSAIPTADLANDTTSTPDAETATPVNSETVLPKTPGKDDLLEALVTIGRNYAMFG
jgi:chromosome segregation ATPase